MNKDCLTTQRKRNLKNLNFTNFKTQREYLPKSDIKVQDIKIPKSDMKVQDIKISKNDYIKLN